MSDLDDIQTPPEPEIVHVEEEGEAIWLMSYADLMTLLFTLFTVLYATSQAGSDEQLKASISMFFGNESLKEYKSGLSKEDGMGQYELLRKSLYENFDSDPFTYDVEVRTTVEGLSITFASVVLFKLGQADLQDADTAKALSTVVESISKHASDHHIRVEGHTDSLPIKSYRYPSNWELSAARASTLIRMFEGQGISF